MSVIQTINPSSNELLKAYQEHSPTEVAGILAKAHHTFGTWSTLSFGERSEKMKKAAGLLREKKEKLARMAMLEMGKLRKDGIAEVEKCAWVCDFYADSAKGMLQDEIIESDASKSYVAFRPLGVILAIMPWNFPYWQVFRFFAPSAMAGNTSVLKHASNVSGCSLEIEALLKEAGMEGVMNSILVKPDKIASVIENPLVKAVTLTGSTKAGRSVASKAGQMLKKTVLELGGSDAYLVLGDADITEAARLCAASRMINTGQSCIAAKRFIVVKDAEEKFTRAFTELMMSKKMGPPSADTSDYGPLARTDLRDALHMQVEESVNQGASCLAGGYIPAIPGAYYPATVLTNVRKGMPAYDDELFGPVAAIIAAEDEQDAIRIANDTSFGLGSSVFTTNMEKGERIAANELQAGSCFVNSAVKSDPRLPFGGIKDSGYGRELSGYGIKEFVNIKTVYIRNSGN